jgi:hypothetical protein
MRVCRGKAKPDHGSGGLHVTQISANRVSAWGLGLFLATAVVAGCQPTVKVEPPKEPITINLNIKLEADVRVKLEKQAGEDIKANPNIF